MIRPATEQDIEAIAQSYEDLLQYELVNGSSSNWKLGVYPTIKVPQQAVAKGTMYVLEEDGAVCASMILNDEQGPEYQKIQWSSHPKAGETLVIHTLCIPPQRAKRGYGKQMLAYAKQFAVQQRYTVIRIDTYAHNEPAKRFYLANGFSIQGYHSTLFEGVIPEELVYMEYIVKAEG
ncbi:MAG: GNAT family N-acetyltransferase [Eubacteriales bacterium]|nr:GNAT family N-acetyltransferase [Eubacteriales bacterium]